MTQYQNLMDSTPALGDKNLLRQRLKDNGYLFLRNVVPKATLSRVLADYVSVLGDEGWLLGNEAELRAVPSRFCAEPQPDYRAVYHRIYRSESLHTVPHEIIDMHLKDLVDGPVLAHPRPIGRIVFPVKHDPLGGGFTTPPHQDYVSVQGTEDFYTCWVPLHAVSFDRGPLAVASGSHTDGVRDTTPAFGTGGTEITGIPEDAWHSSEFELGDIIVFHSHLVHKALPNLSSQFRLSMDFRFQSSLEPIADRSLSLSAAFSSWEDLYSEWQSGRYQYFWRALDPVVVPFSDRFERARDQIAFAYGERGDKRAISVLERIVAHSQDVADKRRAKRLVDKLRAESVE